jgi:hypothetical protein
MDRELAPIESAGLVSRTAHERGRGKRLGRSSLIALPVAAFGAAALPRLPLLGFAERAAVAGLEAACGLVALTVPRPSAKPKTD